MRETKMATDEVTDLTWTWSFHYSIRFEFEVGTVFFSVPTRYWSHQ